MRTKTKKLKWYSFRWQTGVLLVIPIVVVFSYLGYRIHLVTRTLPTGSGPAGPTVPQEPFHSVWSDKKTVFIGLGDSITNGFGAPPEHSYFTLLQNNDDAQYPDMIGCDLKHVLPNLEAYNYAENYTVTQQHLDKQLQKLPTCRPGIKAIIVITSGGNDLIHDYGQSPPKDGAMYGCTYKHALVWTENIKQRLRMLLEGVMSKFPDDCEIFLANIYDPTDGVSDPQTVGLPRWSNGVKVLNLTNRKIAELCDSYENVHLVDIHSEFLGHGIHCTEFWRKHYRKNDPHYWYHANLEDPNPHGYDAIRRLFLLEMIKVLPDKVGQ